MADLRMKAEYGVYLACTSPYPKEKTRTTFWENDEAGLPRSGNSGPQRVKDLGRTGIPRTMAFVNWWKDRWVAILNATPFGEKKWRRRLTS